MKKLLIATKNPGKFKEILEVIGDLPWDFVYLGDLAVKGDEDFIEDGETFEENAWKKAFYYGEKLGMPSIGEDSGIIVKALAGELGVKTRRWGAGEEASDEEWLDFFMKKMLEKLEQGFSAEACFFCNACFYDPLSGERKHFNGKTEGVILPEIKSPLIKGIPLSSCFLPKGETEVYSALNIRRKNLISHRGKAFFALKKFLQNFKGRVAL